MKAKENASTAGASAKIIALLKTVEMSLVDPLVQGPSSGPSQVPRQIHFEGRIQASHRDPSVGQRDRQQGYRLKGGKRAGQAAKKD
jgi:hypothetical protein